jgi:dTDP-4-dehydrorhamnose reductase
MRILVTGREGQLVTSLLERGRGREGLELIAVGRPDLDLEVPGSPTKVVRSIAPDVVVSAAAYTAVDQAEDEPDRAFRINGEAPGELAAVARELGARIIHISTDYVFDGTSLEPYREDAPTNPLSVYGKSKLLGEERVREENPEHIIIRTAWVYSPWGKNFVKSMLAAASGRDELSVVDDQLGNPTNALDLAEAILTVAASPARDSAESYRGTYHFGGTDEMSWAELAECVFRASAASGGPSANVNRIASCDWPTRAVRPANSRLDSSAFTRRFGISPQPLDRTLPQVVERLLA